MREIRMLRSTWRRLKTWHGRDTVTLADERARKLGNTNFDLHRRVSLRPYLCGGARGNSRPYRYDLFAATRNVAFDVVDGARSRHRIALG